MTSLCTFENSTRFIEILFNSDSFLLVKTLKGLFPTAHHCCEKRGKRAKIFFPLFVIGSYGIMEL